MLQFVVDFNKKKISNCLKAKLFLSTGWFWETSQFVATILRRI